MTNPRAVDRVARLCERPDEARALRLSLIDEIRNSVDFDAFAWLLTDPVTEVGASPIADVPSIGELPRLIRLKYLTPVNRWTQLAKPASRLHAATHGRPESSLVWREMLDAYDVGDVASVVFRDRFGCWGFLDLWRIGRRRTFTAREEEFLTLIAAPITDALRRSQARTFGLPEFELSRSGPVVIGLSPGLEVRAQTPATETYLRLLIPTALERSAIPAGAYNVAAQLLAAEAGVDDHPPTARTHLAGGTWLTVRAARMGGPEPLERQDIAVTIESASSVERMDVYVRASGLSKRETEVVARLASGADTRQVAEEMFVSANTVQDHLKSIFAKTGARNRPTLLARALGR